MEPIQPGGEEWVLVIDQVQIHQVLMLADGSNLALGVLALDGVQGSPGSWVMRLSSDGVPMWAKFLPRTQLTAGYEMEDGGYMLIANEHVVQLNPEGGLVRQHPVDYHPSGTGSESGTVQWVQHGSRQGAMLYTLEGAMIWVASDGRPAGAQILRDIDTPPDSISWFLRNAVLTMTAADEILIERHGLAPLAWRTSLAPELDGLIGFEPLYLRSTISGGALLAARITLDSEPEAIWWVQLDPFGAVEWEQMLHSSAVDHVSAQPLPAGGWLIGMSDSRGDSSSNPILTLFRISTEGDLIWSQTWGDGEQTLYFRTVAESPEEDLPPGFDLFGPPTPHEDRKGLLLGFDLFDPTNQLVGRRALIAWTSPEAEVTQCAWIQGEQGLGRLTTEFSSTTRSIVPAEITPLEVSPSQDGPIEARFANLLVHQACVYPKVEPTPTVTPSPTVDLSPIAGREVFPIFSGDGQLVGGVDLAGGWIEPRLTAARIKDSDPFFGYRKGYQYPPFTMQVQPDRVDCHGISPYQAFPPLSTNVDLIFNVPWDPLLRPMSELAPDNATYIGLIDELLRKRGFREPVANIRAIQKIDLDGDGFDEVLIEAGNQSGDPDTWYSIIVLRKVIEGEAKTIVLSDQLSPRPPSKGETQLELQGTYDLDNDGILEIAMGSKGSVDSGSFTVIFDVQNGSGEQVLGRTCD